MGRELERALGAQDIPLRVLLFASLGPGVAWALHFNVVYLLTAMFCSMNRTGADVFIYIATGVLLKGPRLSGSTPRSLRTGAWCSRAQAPARRYHFTLVRLGVADPASGAGLCSSSAGHVPCLCR